MATMHIENTVRDFDAWKAAFDKYEQFRRDNGVLHYRIARRVDDPNRISVDLEFASVADAEAFRAPLAKIWASPQAKENLVEHCAPTIANVVVDHALQTT